MPINLFKVSAYWLFLSKSLKVRPMDFHFHLNHLISQQFIQEALQKGARLRTWLRKTSLFFEKKNLAAGWVGRGAQHKMSACINIEMLSNEEFDKVKKNTHQKSLINQNQNHTLQVPQKTCSSFNLFFHLFFLQVAGASHWHRPKSGSRWRWPW